MLPRVGLLAPVREEAPRVPQLEARVRVLRAGLGDDDVVRGVLGVAVEGAGAVLEDGAEEAVGGVA